MPNVSSESIQDVIQRAIETPRQLHGEIAVARGKDKIWHEIFSYSDAPWDTQINSQYLIGSITKQFTAIALLSAIYNSPSKKINSIEELATELHKPVSKFSNAGLQSVFNGDIPSWVNKVSLHHLLTHTSGIKKKDEASFEDILETNPGEKHVYMNAGYVLIGKLTEIITQTPLEEHFNEKLFVPSGMIDTYFPRKGTPSQIREREKFGKLALGFEYNVIPENVCVASAASKIDFSELYAAGGMVSTIDDLISWNSALYSGKIIPNNLLNIFHTGHIEKDAFELYDGVEYLSYGYGVDVFNKKSCTSYHHSGGVPGYQGRLIYLPTLDISIVHLSNSQKDNDAYKREISAIKTKHNCSTPEAEKIFKNQFPEYNMKIASRAAMFDLANEIRDKVWEL